MKRAYQVTAVLCVLFAVFVAREALSLRLMTRLGPGPGFFPFWLAVRFGGLATIMLFRAEALAPAASAGAEAEVNTVGLVRVGLCLAVLLLSAWFIDTLGFCLTMLGFCLALITIIGERRWYVILPTAVVGSFGVYFVFVRYLGVSLPSGLLSV